MIKKQLHKFFILLLSPAILLIMIVESAKSFGFAGWFLDSGNRFLNIFLFTLSAATAMAFPLFYRTLFINRIRTVKTLSSKGFIRFQKRTLAIVMSTGYIFAAASFLQVSDLSYFGIFLLALYSGYFYFPSKKKIEFELRLFRVKE